jgi:hypothetical protein
MIQQVNDYELQSRLHACRRRVHAGPTENRRRVRRRRQSRLRRYPVGPAAPRLTRSIEAGGFGPFVPVSPAVARGRPDLARTELARPRPVKLLFRESIGSRAGSVAMRCSR